MLGIIHPCSLALAKPRNLLPHSNLILSPNGFSTGDFFRAEWASREGSKAKWRSAIHTRGKGTRERATMTTVRGLTGGLKGAFRGRGLRLCTATQTSAGRKAARGRSGQPVSVSAYTITLVTPDGEETLEVRQREREKERGRREPHPRRATNSHAALPVSVRRRHVHSRCRRGGRSRAPLVLPCRCLLLVHREGRRRESLGPERPDLPRRRPDRAGLLAHVRGVSHRGHQDRHAHRGGALLERRSTGRHRGLARANSRPSARRGKKTTARKLWRYTCSAKLAF